VIKLIKIRVGKATAADFSHPIIFESINREGITLPDSRPLLKKLTQWQDAYSKLNLSKRKLKANHDVTTNISKTELSNLSKKCNDDGKEILKDFNSWLKSNSFSTAIEQQIDPSDRVQILLQIEDKELERLPWHLADIFKRFSSTEVALYKPPGANRPSVSDLSDNNAKNTTVKILAVFGDDSGIDTRNDLEKLKHRFPDLVSLGGDSQEKLTKQTLFEKLDEEQWDILFFAGHSSTNTENQTGKIYLHKECEGLEFEDISNAIDTAVKKGLKIAIFNSCDGLGLGHSLSELGVPQIILMREPVPDIVAQTFLGIFLKLYAQGSSFYQSVSDARKKLQKLDDFPCADWLPTIYQSSTNYPPNWAQLMAPPEPIPEPVNTKKFYLSRVLLTSLITTIAIAATRFTGILQPLELTTFDQTMKLRPVKERVDSNMLVIKITEEDRVNLTPKPNGDDSSLSNYYLNLLLDKLKSHRPKIIGIDIMLDRDISKQYTSIHDSLTTGDLVAACTTPGSTGEKNEHKPPQGANLFGFADLNWDGDNPNSKMIRRQLLSMDTKNIKPGILCNQPYALSTMLAYQYLHTEGVELKVAEDRTLQIGQKKYPLLTTYTGKLLNDEGSQILLNYRLSNNSPVEAVPSISLKEFLDPSLDSDKIKQLVDGKLILIGTTDPFYRDDVTTPYGSISGVYLQAQMASQLISAGLNNRCLITPYPLWGDILIVFGAASIGALLALLLKQRWVFLWLIGGVLLISISTGSIGLLLIGQWFPLIPTLIALFGAVFGVKIYPLLEPKFQSLSANSPAIAPTK
jgi:CHASE2 domain-containing sensor protein